MANPKYNFRFAIKNKRGKRIYRYSRGNATRFSLK